MVALVSAGKNLLYSYVKFFLPYSYVKFFDLSLERGHSQGSQMGTWWQSPIAEYASYVCAAIALCAYALCVGTALLLM